MVKETSPRVLSVSPKTVILAPGYEPRSEVEDLIAGRENKFSKISYQAVFKRLLRGEEDVPASTGLQNVVRNFSPLR